MGIFFRKLISGVSLIFLLVLFFAQHPLSFAGDEPSLNKTLIQSKKCPDLFMVFASTFEQIQKKLDTSNAELNPDPKWSAVIIGRIPGKHGGHLSVVEKKSIRWFSEAVDFEGAELRGDPNWAIAWAGEKAARFLGFKRLGNSHVTIPDATEINRAIELSNQATKDPNLKIVNHFYEPTGDGKISAEIYSKRFLENDEHPLTSFGTLQMHDANFHLLAYIYLPQEVLNLFKAQNKIFMDFEKFIADRKFLGNFQGRRVDVFIDGASSASATISPYYRKSRLGDDYYTKDPLENIKAFLERGNSPAQVIEKAVGNGREIRALYIEFMAQRKNTHPEDFISMDLNAPEFSKKFYDRIEGLNRIWEQLESNMQLNETWK